MNRKINTLFTLNHLGSISDGVTTTLKGIDKGAMNLASGWYIAMPSKALRKKPLAIELFAQPLVAWRDQKDHPVIMERYCSHMGASLAIGKVQEGCIQCPFHHWRFDNSGQCVFIPEVDHFPPTARQPVYSTVERYGYIWVWYGSQIPLFSLPEFPPAEEERDNYMAFRLALDIETTTLRVLENPYDPVHLATIHGAKFTDSFQFTLLNEQHLDQQNKLPVEKEAWFGALVEGRIKGYVGPLGMLVQALRLKSETFSSRIDSWPNGFCVTNSIDGKEKYKILTSITPIAENKVILHSLTMVKKTGKFWPNILSYLVFGWQTKFLTAQDLPVWNTINSDRGGAYIKHDRGVLKFRDFYQSWINKAALSSGSAK